jgi:hypothetical protein
MDNVSLTESERLQVSFGIVIALPELPNGP